MLKSIFLILLFSVEVVESVPVQNQAAAQKLLQKLNQPNQRDRHPRGRRHRGKGQEDDEVVFTLEEYEKRKAQQNPSNKDNVLDISRDEDLAWQLQNQFNLEHSQVCSLISFSRDVNELSCFRFSFCSLFLPLLYLFQCPMSLLGTKRSS
jgi:hypothetical protein